MSASVSLSHVVVLPALGEPRPDHLHHLQRSLSAQELDGQLGSLGTQNTENNQKILYFTKLETFKKKKPDIEASQGPDTPSNRWAKQVSFTATPCKFCVFVRLSVTTGFN